MHRRSIATEPISMESIGKREVDQHVLPHSCQISIENSSTADGIEALEISEQRERGRARITSWEQSLSRRRGSEKAFLIFMQKEPLKKVKLRIEDFLRIM